MKKTKGVGAVTGASAKAEGKKLQAKKEAKKAASAAHTVAKKEIKKETKKVTTNDKDVKKEEIETVQPILDSSSWVYATVRLEVMDKHFFVNPASLAQVYFNFEGEPQRTGSNFLFVDTALYVTGGSTKETASECLNTAEKYLLNSQPRQIVLLKPMLWPCASHKTTSLNQWIYAVGGRNDRLTLRNCEKYSIVFNEWRPIPSVNSPVGDSALCVMKQQTIFKITSNADFETLDANDEDAGWLSFRLNEPWTQSQRIMQSVQISNNQILLLGTKGTIRLTKEKSSYMHIYNLRTRTVSHTARVFFCFYLGALGLQRGCVYCATHSPIHLHQYDLKGLVWKTTSVALNP